VANHSVIPLKTAVTPEDMEFLERRIFRDIPEGWE
jgi:hypothetical protein